MIKIFNKIRKIKSGFGLLTTIAIVCFMLFGAYQKIPTFRNFVDTKIMIPASVKITSILENSKKPIGKQNENENLGTIKKPKELPSNNDGVKVDKTFDYKTIYEYEGSPYIIVNNNVPNFSMKDLNIKTPFEDYSELDGLGRVGVANALLSKELMPTDARQEINSVRPSGWKNKKYDKNLIDGGWVYNRCHLIGFQLAGENANKLNLMTGTRAFNVDGMLPFENEVANHVKNGGKVRYRITPVFKDDELVARGIYLEAQSVDNTNVSIFVYIFNNQKGIDIDYSTGETSLSKN